MKVFISYSSQDKKRAILIAKRLRERGHKIWLDTWELRPGDNLLEKTNRALKVSDALVVIISKHSLKSKWVMHEFSAAALGDLSKKKSRIIPVVVDGSSVPQYLSRYVYIDLTKDFEAGIQRILEGLSRTSKPVTRAATRTKRTYETAIASLVQAFHGGRLTLVCGAGVSIEAGIPSWDGLLLKLLATMMKKISETRSLKLPRTSATQFGAIFDTSPLIVGRYLKTNLGSDFLPLLRDALYWGHPRSSELIDAIIELSRPQRDSRALDSIITFNFDSLIEEGLKRNKVQHRSIYSEGIRNTRDEVPIYHVHGFLPRTGPIDKNTEIVFSEDAYHGQFIDSFSWSNLIQLNKLSQNTCLFLGISLADPNLRRLLDVAHRRDPTKSLNHYIIKRTPFTKGSSATLRELALLLEEQDANELGLNVIWVDDFREIPLLLYRIGRSPR